MPYRVRKTSAASAGRIPTALMHSRGVCLGVWRPEALLDLFDPGLERSHVLLQRCGELASQGFDELLVPGRGHGPCLFQVQAQGRDTVRLGTADTSRLTSYFSLLTFRAFFRFHVTSGAPTMSGSSPQRRCMGRRTRHYWRNKHGNEVEFEFDPTHHKGFPTGQPSYFGLATAKTEPTTLSTSCSLMPVPDGRQSPLVKNDFETPFT
jgi:hypothetical protein